MYSNKKFYLSDSNSNIQKSYLTVVESLMLEILEKFFLQNLFMSSIFNVDYHGKKEICIFSLSTEKWSKLWFFG